ncbi:MAG: hypothetical protein KJ676_05345 [Alphaproteobacteria bacterium]|nr:hypothetical protein [Alphaproteobacteria bacterium]MBU1525171.1 hypothetical protein [Alphaproteobacteria bacterium]MBU2352167.1 hypothetical protein [Alphaproteobacteria bacterium]MBU2381177.1 hypothetical protein [Alphaproteobacteria bacterium]
MEDAGVVGQGRLQHVRGFADYGVAFHGACAIADLTNAAQSVIDWTGLQDAARAPDGKDVRPGDHDLFGWRVRSALPLAGLRPWTGPERSPDLTIRFGKAGPPGDARIFSPAIAIGAGASVFVAIPRVGRFAIRKGSTVVIERADGAPDSALSALLLNEVMPIVCLLRGLVPLRASAVAFHGEAVLLAGMPGVGKSTLAAHLLGQGGRLIGDGFCAAKPDRDDGVTLWPGVGAVQLWADSFAPLGLPSPPPGPGRLAMPVRADAWQTTPARPRRLAIIAEDRTAPTSTAVHLPPGHAMRPRTLVVGWRLAHALGCESGAFATLAAVLAETTCIQLRRGGTPFDLSTMARVLMEAK